MTGTTHLKKMGGLFSTHPGLGGLFVVAGMSLAGMPPFTGFFGKYFLVRAGLMEGRWLIVAVSLLVGTFTLFSMLKVLRYAFWGPEKGTRRSLRGVYGELLIPAVTLVALTVVIGLGARYATDYLMVSAQELLDPSDYIQAVLSAGGKE